MSDSGSSSMSGDGGSVRTRMLERRVSNNRSELNGDGQMNYFITWFQGWSELQKSDFVSVLAEKMAGVSSVNGVSHAFADTHIANGEGNRPPSLFACQVKLFRDWFGGWSDDQKNYLVLRLKDLDGEFHSKYEDFVANPDKSCTEKDYFEPGIPKHMVRHSSKTSFNHDVHPTSVKNDVIEEEEHEEDDLKKPPVDNEEAIQAGERPAETA